MTVEKKSSSPFEVRFGAVKVSSQWRKSKFRDFSIVPLNIYNFLSTQLISTKYSLVDMTDTETFTEPKIKMVPLLASEP